MDRYRFWLVLQRNSYAFVPTKLTRTDLFGAVILIFLKTYVEADNSRFGGRATKWFDFYPGRVSEQYYITVCSRCLGIALNIEHKIERTNAFVTLVFGYSVVTMLFQNKAEYGINA